MTGSILVNAYHGPGDWLPQGLFQVPPSQGFYDVRECELCGELRPLRVWALPGFPMSVGGCFQCWFMDCLPLWLVQAFSDPEMFGPDWRTDLSDGVLDSHTLKDGEYVRIRDLP